ncbi:hypothetical protein G7B40_009245 [Aetokthonos hydrillicola Thurmond2011]|uniref:Uncharacterized protein n=1 Tax=Aetokthonos hydrillicola Thurmond2011 TaxID=2712845 RepID=A0AAP5M8I1_9CYAN|nr:hypothetical protein [Aetokthonos hydrillicola Thurmond2011]
MARNVSYKIGDRPFPPPLAIAQPDHLPYHVKVSDRSNLQFRTHPTT